MTIFVTGASGHLGANVVRQLIAAGVPVRVLCRAGSNNAAVEGLDVEIVEGDLRTGRDIAGWLQGCDAVLHLAAMVSIRDLDREAMVAANVTGTRLLLEAAVAARVPRFVHCSSLGTVGHDGRGRTDEAFFPGPFDDISLYERTKLYAELEVMRAAALGLDACILNPSGLVGPYDFKPSLIGRTILDFARGKIWAYVRGAYDFVPVEDVARAVLLALDAGARGQRYILSGEHVALEEIMRWLSELTGRAMPRVAVPPRVVLPIAGAKDWIERLAFPRRVPRFTKQSIRLLGAPKFPTSARAERELGWSPGPVRDAFVAHVRWFRERGLFAPCLPGRAE